jgi:phage anti-repressor protein
MGDLTNFPLVKLETVGGEQVQAVDARTLHEFLEVGKKFADWIKDRLDGFEEGVDFIASQIWEAKTKKGWQNAIEYILTIETAKHISMAERNEKWKEVRKYFLSVEKAFKKVIQKPRSTIEMLEEAVTELKAKEKEIMRLGTTVQKQNETNIQLFEMTATASKTGMKTIKNDLGAEINHIIFTLFGKMYPGDHRMPHLYARDLYLEKTGKTYWWAKASSMEGKKEYLKWLQTLSPQE